MIRSDFYGTNCSSWYWMARSRSPHTMNDIESIETVGICDLNQEMLKKASNKFRISAYDDYVQMLEGAKPDGVVIVTLPSVRLSLVKEAADRGIHCFIEKPPAKDLESAKKVCKILDQSGVINSVGFMYRYSKAVTKCREMLKGRNIAVVRSMMLDGIALRENWPSWFFDKSVSGGPIFDQAIHMFDLSRYLIGEVDKVIGFQGNQVVPKSERFTIEDSFGLALQYENNGPLQTHNHTWSYPGAICQLEFISNELHLTLDVGNCKVFGNVNGKEVSYDYEDSLYKQELEAFADAIEQNRRDLVLSTYKDSLRSLSVTLSIVNALESGTVSNTVEV